MTNKLTALLITLLLVAVAVTGYITHKNQRSTSADRSAELAALSAQIATLQANDEKLSAELVLTKSRHAEQLRENIETLKRNMGVALSEKDVVIKNQRSTSADRSAELAALSAQIATLQANDEKLSAELVLTKSRHAEQLREDIETLKRNMGVALSEKEGVIKNQRSTLADRSVELVALSAQIATLQTNNEKLSAEPVLTKSRHAEQLREDIETLKRNMGVALSEKDEVIKNQRSTLADRSAELVALSTQIATLQANNEKLSAELVLTKSRHTEQLREDIETLKRNMGVALSEKDAVIKNQRSTSADRSAELAALSAQIATLQANDEELSAELVLTKSRHAEQLREDIETLKRNMGVALSEKEEVIQRLRDTTDTIQLDNDVAFRLGSTQLSASGKTLLLSVIKLIKKYPDYLISLEGHTDNIPIRTGVLHRFPSNWELSAARAAAAARFLQNQGIDSPRLRVVGYGLSRPVGDNDSEQGRAQNRRLEIRFSPKPRIGLTL